MKEDLERAKKLREEKPKGKQVFLQKYWHKGAFHQVCPPSTRHLSYTSQNGHRTKIYSSGTTLLKPLNRLWMFLCFQQLCR